MEDQRTAPFIENDAVIGSNGEQPEKDINTEAEGAAAARIRGWYLAGGSSTDGKKSTCSEELVLKYETHS
ncbi:hypothetical protein NDU88_000814 [Pleurodeles waltl]|uniref:Uncharacterized protein n=1 Tax=Pleurodeles waltl TaxID=8319 RepID=A0AAV7WK37_PLEWA|nr:hypothetical protein NDU88_000814 [Pleurodeles waltl]